MTKGYWALAAALAMVVPATAHADEKESALSMVGFHATSAYGRTQNFGGWRDAHETVRNCTQAIASAKAAGAVAGDLIQVMGSSYPGSKKKGDTWYVTFAQAQKFCGDLTALAVPDMLESRLGNVQEELEEAKKSEPNEHSRLISSGKKSCEDELQKANELGLADNQPFTYFERKTTLGEIRALCAEYEPIGQQLQARWDEQAKAKGEAALAPYKKAGVAGDKLAFIQDEMETRLYSKGGKVIETPQQFAKAAVVCYVVETSEGLYLVHRYRYKGNKLASSDDRSYLTHDKALDNCR